MKVAIYSRVMDEDQWHDVQLFFDELHTQKIEPVVFRPFYQQIKDKIEFPNDFEVFQKAEDITKEIQAIVALAVTELFLTQSPWFEVMMCQSWELTLDAWVF